MEYHLIHKENIDLALAKAKQYRSLLESELAISICLDIFAIDENNQPALVIYILALSDSFSRHNISETKPDKKILDAIKQLKSKYQSIYYLGIFYERKARSLMSKSMSRSFAYDLFIQALNCFEQAEKINDGSDDAVLRYNACVRMIKNQHLQPRQDADDVDWHSES